MPAPLRVPIPLRADLTPAEATLADAWWSRLGEKDRRELADSWDRRAESCAHVRVNGTEEPHWERLDIEVHGIFVDEEEADAADEELPWAHELYEYLVNHEAFICDYWRWFHICTRHPKAAEAIRRGRIPTTFLCPFHWADCPMHALLEKGRGRMLRLVLACRRQGAATHAM